MRVDQRVTVLSRSGRDIFDEGVIIEYDYANYRVRLDSGITAWFGENYLVTASNHKEDWE
jgi:hypothetical protein